MDGIKQQRRSEKSVHLVLDQGKHLDPTFLEASLKNNYKIGLAPFKFEEHGAIVTSKWHKVANVLWWIVFSGLWGLHQWNNMHDTIHFYGLPKAFAVVTTIMRIRYWYQWTDKKKFTKLLKTLKSKKFATFFHSQDSNLFRSIRWTSLLLSLVICSFGLNVIPTRVFLNEEWNWETVFLAHDFSLKRLYNGWLIKSDDHREAWPGTWSGTTVPFGLLGIMLGFCGQLCDTFMLDMMLCSSLELLKTTRDFEPPQSKTFMLDKVELRKAGSKNTVIQVHRVMCLSYQLDKTLHLDDFCTAIFWSIAFIYGIHLCKRRDWVPAILFVFYISKLLLHFFIQHTATLKCKRFLERVCCIECLKSDSA